MNFEKMTLFEFLEICIKTGKRVRIDGGKVDFEDEKEGITWKVFARM